MHVVPSERIQLVLVSEVPLVQQPGRLGGIVRVHRTSLNVLVTVTGALLLVGAVAFAASAPGRSRPQAADLPLIIVDEAAPAEMPAPLPSPEQTTTVEPSAQHDDDDDEREVVTPDVRDSDDEHDDEPDDGESSEHDDSEHESDD